MRGLRSAAHCIALGCILLTTACAVWFVPESRDRGHIFDDASRGAPQGGVNDGQRRLDIAIRREFPPGTHLADLIRHIEDAGGICTGALQSVDNPSRQMTVCRYESITYFAFAFMSLGEPSLHQGDNTWTLAIFHSNGLIDRYDVRGLTHTTQLSKEEYLERLARQMEEEEAQMENSGD